MRKRSNSTAGGNPRIKNPEPRSSYERGSRERDRDPAFDMPRLGSASQSAVRVARSRAAMMAAAAASPAVMESPAGSPSPYSAPPPISSRRKVPLAIAPPPRGRGGRRITPHPGRIPIPSPPRAGDYVPPIRPYDHKDKRATWLGGQKAWERVWSAYQNRIYKAHAVHAAFVAREDLRASRATHAYNVRVIRANAILDRSIATQAAKYQRRASDPNRPMRRQPR